MNSTRKMQILNKSLMTTLVVTSVLCPLGAWADEERPHANLSADSSRAAANDLFKAQVYAEATDANPGDVARRVNSQITGAIQAARNYPTVKVRSNGSNTYPVYGKNGRTIEGWRMRSNLSLESSDATAVSELLGKLQQNLAIASLLATPSPETWKKAEDEAITDALTAFQNRAALIAGSLKKKWKIRQVTVNTNGPSRPPMPYLRAQASMASADASPPALEAGDSQVSVQVNGQIEFLE